jgi:nitrite reductase/ring-hydroxylating ferredoxin subunit
VDWIRACGVEELPEGEAIRLPCDPPIAVFNVAGELYATADTCTHSEASLSEGWVDDDVVECPAHFARFCLRTGRALSAPATVDLPTHAVKVDEGSVYVTRTAVPREAEEIR